MAMDRQKAARAINAGSSLRLNHSQPAVVEADNMVIHKLAENREMSITVNSLYGSRSSCLDSLHRAGCILLLFSQYSVISRVS